MTAKEAVQLEKERLGEHKNKSPLAIYLYLYYNIYR